MEYTPDVVFRMMSRRRRKVMSETVAKPAREAVYVPQNVRSGSYMQLMRSHDRMGTRHLQ